MQWGGLSTGEVNTLTGTRTFIAITVLSAVIHWHKRYTCMSQHPCVSAPHNFRSPPTLDTSSTHPAGIGKGMSSKAKDPLHIYTSTSGTQKPPELGLTVREVQKVESIAQHEIQFKICYISSMLFQLSLELCKGL